ncbi:MAG: hypothetical protein AAF622_11245, partial [Cyanobacteria bacterium P01_C01_bin.147]
MGKQMQQQRFHHRRWQQSLWQPLPVLLLVVALGFMLVSGGIAQTLDLSSAPVVLDGRPLFEVASTSQVNANERADTVSQELEEVVETNEELVVTTEIRNKVPVLLVNDRYLMTVTQNDVELNNGDSPSTLADTWAEQIDQELQSAQAERSETVLQR